MDTTEVLKFLNIFTPNIDISFYSQIADYSLSEEKLNLSLHCDVYFHQTIRREKMHPKAISGHGFFPLATFRNIYE